MRTYFLRRFLLIPPTLLGITLIVFLITRVVPGGPIERALMEARMADTGGGGAVSGVPASVEEIHAVELEPQVVRAIRAVASRRMHDPLSDPRLKIIHNDARAALALTNKQYDVIVSQPSHPWTAGASHIYTREFLQLARQRLTDDGVFLQWMDASFIDDLGADSLDIVELVMAFEEEFGVEIPDDAAEKIATVKDAISYIDSNKG